MADLPMATLKIGGQSFPLVDNKALRDQGAITATTSLDDLAVGIYAVNGIANPALPLTGSFFGVLIQFGGNYKPQLCVAGMDGQSNTYTRRWMTASSQWTPWVVPYQKPSGGIPKADLASAVQTSLGRADSALQSAHNTDANAHADKFAGKRDKTDNVCHETSAPWFVISRFVDGYDASMFEFDPQPERMSDNTLMWTYRVRETGDEHLAYSYSDPDESEVEFGDVYTHFYAFRMSAEQGEPFVTPKSVAGVMLKNMRDRTDNTCHATTAEHYVFKQWISGSDAEYRIIGQPYAGGVAMHWDVEVLATGETVQLDGYNMGDENEFAFYGFPTGGYIEFEATRIANIAVSDEIFTTHGFVLEKLKERLDVIALADAYDNYSLYYINDVVSFNGEYYQCIAECGGNPPPDSGFWKPLNLAGIIREILATTIPPFSTSKTYERDEVVLFNGVAYRCIEPVQLPGAFRLLNWSEVSDAILAERFAGLKSDGTATDQFATNLFGKPVAKEAMHYDIYSMPEPSPITDPWALHDRAVNAFEMWGDERVAFPAAIEGKCRDFLILVNFHVGELTLPTGNTYYGDAPTMDAEGTYLIALTEIAENTWYMRTIKMETPA